MNNKKFLYEVEAIMPVTPVGARFPIDWKNPDFRIKDLVKKGEFGYDQKTLTVPAKSEEEAVYRVSKKLEEAFYELPPMKPYIKFCGGIKNNSPEIGIGIGKRWSKRMRGSEVSAEKLDTTYVEFDSVKSDYYAFSGNSKRGWQNLGIILCFKEVWDLIYNHKLPEKFIRDSRLIPPVPYTPCLGGYPYMNKDDPAKKEIIRYNGEKLTKEIQTKIVEGLLNNEEENARGHQLSRNHFLNYLKSEEFFPEETHFWAYNPKEDPSSFYSRFSKICYFWNREWHQASTLCIGTKKQISKIITRENMKRTKKLAQEIKDLQDDSTKIINSLSKWPGSLKYPNLIINFY